MHPTAVEYFYNALRRSPFAKYDVSVVGDEFQIRLGTHTLNVHCKVTTTDGYPYFEGWRMTISAGGYDYKAAGKDFAATLADIQGVPARMDSRAADLKNASAALRAALAT